MPTVTPQLSKELEVIKTETAPVIARAATLVVQNAQDYAIADSFLDRLVGARKSIKARLAKIIDPIKEALDQAKSLLKEADGPLEQSEILIRGRMREFKLEEARQARIEEEKRYAAEEKLRQEVAAKALAESKAKTQQMRDKLAAQRAELEAQADVAAAAPAQQTVKAVGSTVRKTTGPVVTNASRFIQAIVSGEVKMAGTPLIETLLNINESALKQLYKIRPDEVAKWPGIEIVDDIQIVKR